MKKKIIYVVLCIGILGNPGILWSENVWTGYAAVGSNKDFTKYADGFRATSNTFPEGTLLRVSNPKTGKNVEVEIVGRLNTPGVLILIEESGATNIGLPNDRVMPVRVAPIVSRTRMQTLAPALTPEESLSEPYTDSYLRDPDYNPAATFGDEATTDEALAGFNNDPDELDNLITESSTAEETTTKAADTLTDAETKGSPPLAVVSEPAAAEATKDAEIEESPPAAIDSEAAAAEKLSDKEDKETPPFAMDSEAVAAGKLSDKEDKEIPPFAMDSENDGKTESSPVDIEEFIAAPSSEEIASDSLTKLDNLPEFETPGPDEKLVAYSDNTNKKRLARELEEYPVAENKKALEGEIAEFIETDQDSVKPHSDTPDTSTAVYAIPKENTDEEALDIPQRDTYTPTPFSPRADTDIPATPSTDNTLVENEDESRFGEFTMDNNDKSRNNPNEGIVEDDISKWLKDSFPATANKDDLTELTDGNPFSDDSFPATANKDDLTELTDGNPFSDDSFPATASKDDLTELRDGNPFLDDSFPATASKDDLTELRDGNPFSDDSFPATANKDDLTELTDGNPFLDDSFPAAANKDDLTELTDGNPLIIPDENKKFPGETKWPGDIAEPGIELIKDDKKTKAFPNGKEDAVKMDANPLAKNNDGDKPRADAVYFLSPADLRPPPEPLEETKKKPLPANGSPELKNTFEESSLVEAPSANLWEEESVVLDDSADSLLSEPDAKEELTDKKSNTDARSILDLSNIKQYNPESNESYIQVGYYATKEELVKEAKNLKENYPLPSNVYLSYDKKDKFHLLIGPVRPAEKGVVLKNIRAGAVPDAFIYSSR